MISMKLYIIGQSNEKYMFECVSTSFKTLLLAYYLVIISTKKFFWISREYLSEDFSTFENIEDMFFVLHA